MAPEIDWQRRAEAAEKTVAVLKRKVDDLYGGGAQSQIHRQLEKARLREERNRLRTDQLERYSQELEASVTERTRAIRTILDHVTFGFFLLDQHACIGQGFTRSCEALFGTAPREGQKLAELLGLSGVRESELLLAVDQVFEDILPEQVSAAQLPSRHVHTSEDGERVLSLEASVVRDEAGRVDGLLVTVNDITRLETAEREAKQREVLLTILNRRAAFESFVADTELGLAAASRTLDEATTVRRIVHTVKGNAASWGLEGVVARAHEVEAREAIDEASITSLRSALGVFLEANESVLGVQLGDGAQQAFEVTTERLRALREMVSDPSRAHEVEDWIQAVVHRPARDLLGPIDVFVEKLSERLDKTIRFQLEGTDLMLDAERMRPVFAVVPHLVRNAVDHGIEPRSARGDKPPHGSLTISVDEGERDWCVAVADDGRGVPYEELVQKALTLGRLSPEAAESLSDDDRVELLFHDGLSTAQTMTDISGRGVGMSAVRNAVLSVGGSTAVTSSARGTTVEIRVPKSA